MYGIEHSDGLWHGIRTVALSRLQERISLLSSKAVTVDDPEEFNLVFAELRNALRGQLSHLREMVDEAKRTISQLPGEPRVGKTNRVSGAGRKDGRASAEHQTRRPIFSRN
jgi:methyl-accepting chemotaxis protein